MGVRVGIACVIEYHGVWMDRGWEGGKVYATTVTNGKREVCVTLAQPIKWLNNGHGV